MVKENDPSQRTYKIVHKPPDGLAYAMYIAGKHGLTHEQSGRKIHVPAQYRTGAAYGTMRDTCRRGAFYRAHSERRVFSFQEGRGCRHEEWKAGRGAFPHECTGRPSAKRFKGSKATLLFIMSTPRHAGNGESQKMCP